MTHEFFQGPAAEALVQAQIDVATLQTEVKHLTIAVGDLKASNKAMADQLTEIRDLLTQAKGGWKTMMYLGGAGATLGAFVTWALDHIALR